jgi:hypothetical protein
MAMIRITAISYLIALLFDALVAAWFFRTPWILPVALIAGAGLVMVLRPRQPKGTEQVAGWCLGPAVELTNPDRPEAIDAAVVSKHYLNLGFLTIGAPGSGKTLLALSYIDSLKTHSPRSGWAYFEGKGDTDIYRKCVSMGSAPKHFFSSELPGSASINLIAGDPHDVIDRLGKVLIGFTASTSYYTDLQRAVLSKVIPLLLGLGVPANLRDLYTVLTVEDAGLELLRRARSIKTLDPVAVTLARQWFETPIDERLGQVGGLLNRLFVFVSGPYADRLNAYQPDIDIAAVVAAGESVYFHLPLTAFSRDVAIAVIEAFGVEARKRQLGGTENLESYPLIFDDWGAFFHEGFGPFSARCRSAAMPLAFSFQSRAQLQYVSPTYADELDDTIATKIILRVHGAATARYAVELLGEYETREVAISGRASSENTSLSLRRMGRIDPRALRQLQTGEAYVSTLEQRGEREHNPLWRVRLPLPPYTDWQSVPMPTPRQHAEGQGLGFWGRYMNPALLAQIHARTLAAEEEDECVTRADAVLRQRDARHSMASNPGLVEDFDEVERG